MKVLFFLTQFYETCGAERLAVELAEELNKHGIHADVLSMYTEDLPGVAEAKEDLLKRGIPEVRFLGMKVHPSIASVVPAIVRLRRLIRKEKYDIVETSNISTTVLASWATSWSRAHHVAGLHQVFRRDRENSFRHKVWRFSVRCNPHIRYYSISNYASQSWVRYSGTPTQHTRTVLNAIPNDCFEEMPDRQHVRRELGIPDDGRIALYIGRLAAYKGIDTLLDSLGPVLEQVNLYLLYVGRPDLDVQGSVEMVQEMKKRIRKEGWDDRVRFLGYRKDVPRLLASADVLTHPTRMEGFGLTLVEAMAAGLPVVASNVEGIPEILEGTDSIMVPPDDPLSLRDAVLETINRSPDEAARARDRGRKKAGEFRMKRRTEEMIKLFHDVLGTRSSSLVKKKILVNGPFVHDYAGGGYIRSLLNYLNGFKSIRVELQHCPHSFRKFGSLFFMAFPWRLLTDISRALRLGLTASGAHILGQYRTAIFREAGIVLLFRLIRVPILYELKAGAFINWYGTTNSVSRSLMKFVLRSAKVILCEGQRDVEFLEREFSLKSHYFPNFVLAEEVPERVPKRLLGKEMRVAFLGHCFEGKGVFELVKGCKMATDMGMALKLTLVGHESPNFKAFLDEFLENNPSMCIKRLGKVDHSRALAALKDTDVFCMPTRHTGEGHTNAVNEAMMMGTIIVTTRHGFLESVLQGNCAYFLDELTPTDISKTLKVIHDDPESARRKAMNARQRLMTHFTSDVAFAELERYYAQLISDDEIR